MRQMIGAIAGDIIGSVYEHHPIKTKDFPLFHPHCRFTDDSVLTAAIAKAVLDNLTYTETVLEIGRMYPRAGYGSAFKQWLRYEEPEPYNSWGNGSAMRVSPIGYAFETESDVLDQAKLSAEISHNHPEGIKGAQATALAVFLSRTTRDKKILKSEVMGRFGYDLNQTIEDIKPTHHFDVSCQGSAPQSIRAFLEAESYEDAVRNAISLGGDSDTQACIAGAIAEAYYGPVPDFIFNKVKQTLDDNLWEITARFTSLYMGEYHYSA